MSQVRRWSRGGVPALLPAGRLAAALREARDGVGERGRMRARRIACGGREPFCGSCGMKHWAWAEHVRVRVDVFRFGPAVQDLQGRAVVFAVHEATGLRVMVWGRPGEAERVPVRWALTRLQRRLDRGDHRRLAKSEEDPATSKAGNAAGRYGYHTPRGPAAAAIDYSTPFRGNLRDMSRSLLGWARNQPVILGYRPKPGQPAHRPDPSGAAECRVMSTRRCPSSGCVDLPCARFEDDDESRWDSTPDPPGTARCEDPLCPRYGQFAIFGGLNICPREHVISGVTGA